MKDYRAENLDVTHMAAIYYKEQDKGMIFYALILKLQKGQTEFLKYSLNMNKHHWVFPAKKRVKKQEWSLITDKLGAFLKSQGLAYEFYIYTAAQNGAILKTTVFDTEQ